MLNRNIKEQSRDIISKKVKPFLLQQATLVFLIVIIIVLVFVAPGFFSVRNIFNLFRQNAVIGIMAIGMTYVIIGKGIDLSISGMLAFCLISTVLMQTYGYLLSVVAAVAAGILCGLLNGYIISSFKAHAIIVTLSTGLIYAATALIISDGKSITTSSARVFSFVGNESILGIPVLLYIMIILFIIFGFILKSSIYGRRLYSTGLNEKAALVTGIKTSSIILGSYVIQGFTVGVAAIIMASRLNTVRANIESSAVFDVITIVVLGGTALSGGKGSMYKTVIGFLIFSVLINSMGVMNLQFEYQQVIKGVVLIGAVILDQYMRRKVYLNYD